MGDNQLMLSGGALWVCAWIAIAAGQPSVALALGSTGSFMFGYRDGRFGGGRHHA